MLSDQEIVRRLRAIRHSPASLRNARKAPSINAIALRADLSRNAVYVVASTGRVGPNARPKLVAALTCHETDRARSGV
jgi:hypothetical protein